MCFAHPLDPISHGGPGWGLPEICDANFSENLGAQAKTTLSALETYDRDMAYLGDKNNLAETLWTGLLGLIGVYIFLVYVHFQVPALLRESEDQMGISGRRKQAQAERRIKRGAGEEAGSSDGDDRDQHDSIELLETDPRDYDIQPSFPLPQSQLRGYQEREFYEPPPEVIENRQRNIAAGVASQIHVP